MTTPMTDKDDWLITITITNQIVQDVVTAYNQAASAEEGRTVALNAPFLGAIMDKAKREITAHIQAEKIAARNEAIDDCINVIKSKQTEDAHILVKRIEEMEAERGKL